MHCYNIIIWFIIYLACIVHCPKIYLGKFLFLKKSSSVHFILCAIINSLCCILFRVHFYIFVTDQMTFSLRCKLNCPHKLSYMYGQKHDDLFVSHYHYLQYNYYKSKYDKLRRNVSRFNENFIVFSVPPPKKKSIAIV